MTANEGKSEKLKARSILPTSENNVPDLHRPFSCSWYRIVFKPVVQPDYPPNNLTHDSRPE